MIFSNFETELNTITKNSTEKDLSLGKLNFWKNSINEVFEVV